MVILCIHLALKGLNQVNIITLAVVTVDDNDLVYVSDQNGYISVYMPNGEYKCRIPKHCNKKKLSL